LVVRITRAFPRWPLVKQLALPLRRAAVRSLDGPVDSTLWGHRLRFHPHRNISERRLLFLPEGWDSQERALLERILEPGTVFLDVGCNFGGYSWWVLSRLGRDCTVVALEPDPELHARLRFNLATNGWDHVRVLASAVGEEEGRGILHLQGTNQGENTLLPLEEGVGSGAVAVEVRPLKAVALDQGLERIAILKMDIKGMEPPVLRAFFESDPGPLRPRWIFCETKDTPDYRELEALLENQGYSVVLRTRLNMALQRLDSPGSP
jgi:FkbM family methyltransferase